MQLKMKDIPTFHCHNYPTNPVTPITHANTITITITIPTRMSQLFTTIATATNKQQMKTPRGIQRIRTPRIERCMISATLFFTFNIHSPTPPIHACTGQ
jgi:hypothetical protein